MLPAPLASVDRWLKCSLKFPLLVSVAMVYGGPRRNIRKTFRARATARQIARQAPTANNQKDQLMSLSSELNSIKRKRRQELDWTQFQITANNILALPYVVWGISEVTSWTRRFGAAPSGQAMLRKIEVDIQVQINSEPSPVTYSMFLISLKETTSAQLIANTTAALSGLVENTHYTLGPAANGGRGQAYLNPAFFKIHKTRRFQLSGLKYDTAGDEARNQVGTVKRFAWTIPFKRRLVSGRGSWDENISSVPNSARLYVLIFNDNSTVDGESPYMTGNALIHVTSS